MYVFTLVELELSELFEGGQAGQAGIPRRSSRYFHDISDLDGFTLVELEICNCPKLTLPSLLLSCKTLIKLRITYCAVLDSMNGMQSLDQLSMTS